LDGDEFLISQNRFIFVKNKLEAKRSFAR